MPHRSQFKLLDSLHEAKAEVITQASILEPCQFPTSNGAEVAVEASRMRHVDISINEKLVLETTKHNVSRLQWFQTAWAILLRCYVGNDSVSFGILPIRQDDMTVNHQLWLRRFTEASQVMACQLQISAEDSVLATIQWVSISKYPRSDFEAHHINTALTLSLSFPSRHRHRDINHYVQHLRGKSAPDVCYAFFRHSCMQMLLNVGCGLC